MVENLLKERYELAAERVRGIEQEKNVPERFQDYFEKTGKFLVQMLDLREQIVQGELERMPLEELRELNRSLYGDILPENYENSYGNPAYACKVLGEAYGVTFKQFVWRAAGNDRLCL